MTQRIRVGRRAADGAPWDDLLPGDYCWCPRHYPPCWVACCPETGGDLLPLDPDAYSVTLHDDGLISVEEEIVFPRGWHGYLSEGSWRKLWP